MSDLVNELIEHILFDKIMRCIHDAEELSNIITSKEYELVTKMETEFESKKNTTSHSVNSLIEIWNNFYNSVQYLNKNELNLLDIIKSDFKIKFQNSFSVIGAIIKHSKYIKMHLSKDQLDNFCKYLEKLELILLDFRISFIVYAKTKLQYAFANNKNSIDDNHIKYKKIEKINNSIYADQNIISKILDKPAMLSLVKMKGIKLVYSSYVIEDALKKNPIYMPLYIDGLMKLTGGNMVGYMKDGLCFVNENINVTLNRASLYSKLSKLYEKDVLLSAFQRDYLYPELRKNSLLNQKLSADFINFFKNESKTSIEGFNTISYKFSHDKNLHNFITTGCIGDIDDYRQTISNLNALLDFVNFKTETVSYNNRAKIYSSYRDSQHIEHAYVCDYFATDDKNLSERAKVIFKIIGCTTKVISSNEMLSLS